jgi:16S rRNA (guanine(966)-N(2))-methyltransferase RsmD
MRVIAGKYRSRVLKSLKGPALRPTSDRLRETLFDVLGRSVEGSRFLDIFAGTGAVGIEALSRGAAHVVFIENHPPAAKLIRENLASLGIGSSAEVICGDALKSLEKMVSRFASSFPIFDFVFLDPPYASEAEYSDVLAFLGASRMLSANALVVAEHRRKFELPEIAGALRHCRVLRQGDAALSFYRKESAFPQNAPA